MEKKPPLFVMLSLPGTGKGTQGTLLAEQLKGKYLVVGDMIREVYAQGPVDQFHKDLIERYDKGIIQPDATFEKIFEIIISRISKEKISSGLVLDTILSMRQVEILDRTIKKFNLAEPIVIYLEVDDDEIIRRLSDRKICIDCKTMVGSTVRNYDANKCNACGGKLTKRSDDKEEIVRGRIEQYKERLKPILEYYEDRGQLVRVNGEQSVEAVFGELWDKVKLRM